MILEIKNLNISLKKTNTLLIDNLNLDIKKSSILGLIGESGSGKSIISMSITNLLDNDIFSINAEYINFNGLDIFNKNFKKLKKFLGSEISYIFQEPMTSLNPVLNVENQLLESLKIHKKFSIYSKDKILNILREVEFENPELILKKFPHQLSGGQRQRILIAMALINDPKLLIADEPTTALDRITANSILKLLKNLSSKRNLSILFISHDLNSLYNFCDEICVLYLGKIMEYCSCENFFKNSKHPYSLGLLKSSFNYNNQNRLFAIDGSVPNINEVINSCPFSTRCLEKKEVCEKKIPPLLGSEHKIRCFFKNSK